MMPSINDNNTKYLHIENLAFSQGKLKRPAHRDEILHNIRRKLPGKPSVSRVRVFGSCLTAFIGGIVAIIGLSMFVTLIQGFIAALNRGINNAGLNVISFILIGASLVGIVVGLTYAWSIVSQIRDPARQVYRRLIRNGVGIVGEVIAVKSSDPSTNPPENTIRYRFCSPNGTTTEGLYITSDDVDFSPGDRVTVWYLDYQTHVIL